MNARRSRKGKVVATKNAWSKVLKGNWANGMSVEANVRDAADSLLLEAEEEKGRSSDGR